MLDILHEDPHILVVAKPAGVASQGRRATDASMETSVREYLATVGSSPPFLGTLHRLDRPVSGVIAWAKNPRAARRISEQFADRRTVKEYVAAVSGRPSAPEGVWEDWLYEQDTGLGVVQVCRPGTPRARRAVTRFTLDATAKSPSCTSVLDLRPETGRTHQLRVQSGSRGLPILGDSAYGSKETFAAGIALHARALTIVHPVTERTLRFEAPFPESWARAGIEPTPDVSPRPRCRRS